MPLDRKHITRSNAIMLPAYFVFCSWVGLVYALDPGGRVAASVHLPVFPQQVWGFGFVAIALMMVLSAATRNRDLLLAGALAPMFCWLAFWSGSNAYFAVVDKFTWSAPAFTGVIATSVLATMLSLAGRDRDR